MATLTDNPTKTAERPASVNGAAAVELGEGVKPVGASRIGDVHYWNGKPLPPIFYEDPEPVEDGMLQDETIVRIVEALRRRCPKDFVKGGGFVMYDPDDGNNRFASDGYISFGVSREYVQDVLRLRNYYIWVVRKGIDFALEVASPSTADNDMNFKRKLYEQLGIGEYWMLDRFGDLYGKRIIGLRLVNGKYEEYEVREEPDGSLRSYSEMLDLEFWWVNGAPSADPFDLRDPATGKSICADNVIAEQLRIIQAERDARIAAERRAEVERESRIVAVRRAEAERESRIAAVLRAEIAERRKRELLRRLEELEGQG